MVSLPPEEVYQSVLRQAAFEWQRIGSKLGFTSSQIKTETFNIPTCEGKLHAMIEKKSNEVGKCSTVEALLDACQHISPAVVDAILQELNISGLQTV